MSWGGTSGSAASGRLVAMAGERLHPDGWTEISAVAVDADHRRQGLASRLVLDVAFHIQQRGDRALLHALGRQHRGDQRLREARLRTAAPGDVRRCPPMPLTRPMPCPDGGS